jgi:hypothetical protein
MVPDMESQGAGTGATLTHREPFNADQVVRTVQDLLNAERLPAILRPHSSEQTMMEPVSILLNNPTNDSPECRADDTPLFANMNETLPHSELSVDDKQGVGDEYRCHGSKCRELLGRSPCRCH